MSHPTPKMLHAPPAKPIGLGFWLRWVSATVFGFLASLFWIEVGFRSDVGALQGAIGGAIIGIAQWLVLRPHISQANLWGFTCVAGWSLLGWSGLGALGWVAPRGMSALVLRSLHGGVDGLRVGFVLGVLQWLILRKQVPFAWRWVLGSAAAWGLGLAVGWTAGAFLRVKTGLFLGEVVGLLWGWVVVSAITGIILIDLLRSNHSSRPADPVGLRKQYRSSKRIDGS